MKYYKVIFSITDTLNKRPASGVMLQTACDIVCALAGECGFESFEEYKGGVCGYAQKSAFNGSALDAVLKSFPLENISVSYDLTDAEDKNWNQTWEKQGFEPIIIDGKCIIHDTLHPIITGSDEIKDIIIDTQQAFGTGTHDTTKMIVTELLNINLKGLSVLDCGCGTGILSIVSSISGAEKVVGYDIDEWSVKNTKHNCKLNGIKNIESIEGNSDIIKLLNKNFNIVLANINRNILLADMPKFCDAMAENGILILSGFYTEDAPLLKEKAESLSLSFIKSNQSNNWCMLVFRK